MKKLALSSAALIAGILSASAQSAELLVDDFTDSDSPPLVVNDGAPGPLTSTVSGSMLGGERDISLEYLAGSTSGRNSTVDISSGIYSWSNDSDNESQAFIYWDGTSGGGLDGYALGEDVSLYKNFSVDVPFADANAFAFTIGFYNDAANFTRITLISDGSSGTVNFDLASWENPVPGCGGSDVPGGVLAVECGAGDATVNFDNTLGAIEFGFLSLIGGVDLDIDNVRFTVPTPGTLALFGGALLGLGFVRRRSNKAAV